jgi:hypothetical protein
MKQWERLVALLIFFSNVSVVAAQEIVTICKGSAGYGYYLEPRRDEWQKDGIKDGLITVVRDAAGTYDIIVKDTMTAFSAKGDGARVVKVDGSDNLRFTLVVIYPLPVTEIYQFTLDPRGRGTLIWAGVKNGAPPAGITKGTLFTATCSK